MKVVQGWCLPNSDSHMEQYFRAIGKPEYQPAHRATAVSYCDKFRVALVIGAHVGLWARDLTDRFDTVFAFEPCPEYAELLTKNAPKAVVHRYALGSCEKSVLLDSARQYRHDPCGAWFDWAYTYDYARQPKFF